jgi:hypothetical protein
VAKIKAWRMNLDKAKPSYIIEYKLRTVIKVEMEMIMLCFWAVFGKNAQPARHAKVDNKLGPVIHVYEQKLGPPVNCFNPCSSDVGGQILSGHWQPQFFAAG